MWISTIVISAVLGFELVGKDEDASPPGFLRSTYKIY